MGAGTVSAWKFPEACSASVQAATVAVGGGASATTTAAAATIVAMRRLWRDY